MSTERPVEDLIDDYESQLQDLRQQLEDAEAPCQCIEIERDWREERNLRRKEQGRLTALKDLASTGICRIQVGDDWIDVVVELVTQHPMLPHARDKLGIDRHVIVEEPMVRLNNLREILGMDREPLFESQTYWLEEVD